VPSSTKQSNPPAESADVGVGAAGVPSAEESTPRTVVEGSAVGASLHLAPAVSLPNDFEFDEVRPAPRLPGPPTPVVPPLGPLAAFKGDWEGKGFNTIFRPDNPETPTKFPIDVPPSDNVLELNLTLESLSFSPELGNVPNRGSVQGDIFLNGIPYLQAIKDVTTAPSVGIHLEPGLWVIVPPTTVPPISESTLVRMASIPHGATICAQGTFKTFTGAPNIPPADITPFIAGSPNNKIPFPSQTAANGETPRIPQDLTPFIDNGTITQAILSDPNTVLRNANAGLHIVGGTAISIATTPAAPLFGGGTDNIAFLLGHPAALVNPDPPGQNAQTIQMSATFWIEEVQYTIVVPPYRLGEPPLKLQPEGNIPGHPTPTFTVRPPIAIESEREITFSSTQIQYSQRVELNFNGLSWPHVSVATLVPANHSPVPASAW
jgi:hypothetical protein